MYTSNYLVSKEDHLAWKKQFAVLLGLLIFFLLLSPSAYADPLLVMPSPMPWESFTKTLACTLSGAWIKWMAVIAVALGGVMFGLGELSGPFQRTMQIAGGFSIAVGAVAVVGYLIPTSGTANGVCTGMIQGLTQFV